MVGGGQCSSVIVVILTLLGDDRGAPSGWRIIHSNNNNSKQWPGNGTIRTKVKLQKPRQEKLN